jgi:UDP-2,3-diacylglucosamine pyrophosphatase LpxH
MNSNKTINKYKKVYNRLNNLFENCLQIDLKDNDKYVIFSDTHIGNGGYQDDFKHNSEMFSHILSNHYLPRNFNLVLNGDIEELYKFKLSTIRDAWKSVFDIFKLFADKNQFYKIFGNHDFTLTRKTQDEFSKNLLEGIRLEYENNSIFIYHGHQIAHFLEDYNLFSSWFGRFILNPIGYKNITYPIYDNSKFITEKLGYKFAAEKKIISILGHTHRPLFESHSKIDSLKMTIEKIIEQYAVATFNEKNRLFRQIQKLKKELNHLYEQKKNYLNRSSLYNEQILIPCLFNSGSVIGKRGMTGIEISKGKIALVYWFDKNRSKRYIDYDGVKSKQFQNTPYFKAVLKREYLKNIFTRIELLA